MFIYQDSGVYVRCITLGSLASNPVNPFGDIGLNLCFEEEYLCFGEEFKVPAAASARIIIADEKAAQLWVEIINQTMEYFNMMLKNIMLKDVTLFGELMGNRPVGRRFRNHAVVGLLEESREEEQLESLNNIKMFWRKIRRLDEMARESDEKHKEYGNKRGFVELYHNFSLPEDSFGFGIFVNCFPPNESFGDYRKFDGQTDYRLGGGLVNHGYCWNIHT